MKAYVKDILEYKQGEIIQMSPFLLKKKHNSEHKSTISDSKPDVDKSVNDKNEQINELILRIDTLTNVTEQLIKDKSKIKGSILLEFCTFIVVLLTAFCGAFVYLDNQFDDINQRIDNCLTSEDIDDLEKSVARIKLWVEGDINNINLPGANRRIDKIEELLNISPINIDDDIASNLLYNSGMEDNHSPVPTSLNPKTYLGEDSNGNKYNIEDIINKKVLLTYNEDEKEIYFFGELNDQLYWDGDCLTNAYNSNGILYGICESKFENGNRKSYESFYLSSSKDEWIYTSRTCTEDGNLGLSEIYFFTYNKIKNFTNSNARISDLLYIKDFNNNDNKILISTYYGLTKNGEYNDNTGQAYLIKYFMPDDIQIKSDKPIIKLLYQGKFVGGQPSDEGYDSWSISREVNTTYMFYKGGFSGGKSHSKNKDKEEFENYLTHDKIDEYLQKYGFNNYSDNFVTEYEE